MSLQSQAMKAQNTYIRQPSLKQMLFVGYATCIGLGAFAQSTSGYAAQSASAKTNAPQSVKPAVPAKPAVVVPDLPRADFIVLMDADFKKRDLDQNGKATRAEVEEFTKRAAAAVAQEQNRELFQRLDIDKNGVITPAEFAELIPAPKFIDVSAEMTRFDSNRDQIITLVEYRTATLANFDRLDVDKDGILSAAETSRLTTPTSNGTTNSEQSR
jgi:Ca2+-binding EF-hand superfamily protein